MDGTFLDWALESFSGYVAADELYEGPYCVLSVVDNRQYKRILYEVLDYDPTHEDITGLFQRLKMVLTLQRRLTRLRARPHAQRRHCLSIWLTGNVPQLLKDDSLNAAQALCEARRAEDVR